MRYVIAILLISACGQQATEPKPKSVATESVVQAEEPDQTSETDREKIDRLLAVFSDEMESRGIAVDYSRVEIKTGLTVEKNFIGQTVYNPIRNIMEITLRYDWKDWTLYHELGHALWQLPHTDNPSDIMSANIPPFDIKPGQFDVMAEQIRNKLDKS